MANQVGTATGLFDLFDKIVDFLTTDSALVAAGQEWEVLRIRRDNLAEVTTNLVEPSDASYRKVIHCCRYDPRSLNTDSPVEELLNELAYTNFSAGTSFVRFKLREAKAVTTVRLRAPRSTNLTHMLRNFRLQWSDNGTTWTNALRVTGSVSYNSGEWRDYAVSGSTSHLYWRVVIDSSQSSTHVTWESLLLLTSDGTVANHFGSEVIFKASGNAGAESIYTGIRAEYDAANGWYNLFMNGYTGFDPGTTSWFEHPGALPGAGAAIPCVVPMVPCWDTTMPYWFSASGRSFRFAVKVSTSYEGGYLGFYLPYATPSQFPYPLAVGGSLVPQSGSRSVAWRYSYASYYHGVFPGPGCDNTPNGEGRHSTLYTRTPAGVWAYHANRPGGGVENESVYGPITSADSGYDQLNSGAIRSVWPHCVNNPWGEGRLAYRECLGGGYMIQPCVLLQRSPTTDVFGELEGVYSISGYENAAENTAVIGGKTYVTFQNAYRTSVHEYWALSLD